MPKCLIMNSGELVAFVAGLSAANEYPIRIDYKAGAKPRSLSANAQYHVWLPQIAKFYGEDVEYIRKWMKHLIAWPILERDNCEYSVKVRYMLTKSGYDNLSELQKINMLDLFGVTRFMDSKQHTELRDELQIYWAKNGLNLEYMNG